MTPNFWRVLYVPLWQTSKLYKLFKKMKWESSADSRSLSIEAAALIFNICELKSLSSFKLSWGQSWEIIPLQCYFCKIKICYKSNLFGKSYCISCEERFWILNHQKCHRGVFCLKSENCCADGFFVSIWHSFSFLFTFV